MLGHGYEVGANRSYNQHRITHTMAHVGPGDVLKLYDVAPPKALLGSVVINTATSLESAPIPQEWANTPWAKRVHPDALQLWQVTYREECTGGPCALPNGSFSALVQIDRFASAGADVFLFLFFFLLFVFSQCSLFECFPYVRPEPVLVKRSF